MSPRSVRIALVGAIVLQAIVLAALPLFAGPRMPSGATVQLEAYGTPRDEDKGVPSNELALDYGFDDVELPASLEPGDTAYLELLDAAPDAAARFGKVVESLDALPEGSTWIKLPVVGPEHARGMLEAGPISNWWEQDDARATELQQRFARGESVLVTVELDPDGDPEIERVVAPATDAAAG